MNYYKKFPKFKKLNIKIKCGKKFYIKVSLIELWNYEKKKKKKKKNRPIILIIVAELFEIRKQWE